VSYFAAALVRGAGSWAASEFTLGGLADIEDVAERMRDLDPDAATALLFVESDDSYLVIVRLDDGEDLRVFGSDAAFADESRLGALLLGEIEEPVLDIEDEPAAPADDDGDQPPLASPDADPVGDADLLADFGLPSGRLLALCAQEGMLPSDITAEVCQILGAGDEVEELREA
jgi:putative tRNA adenosine deaminase-associated protein